MMHSYHLFHDLNGALPIETCAWATVHQVGNLITPLLAVSRQHHTIGQELSNPALMFPLLPRC